MRRATRFVVLGIAALVVTIAGCALSGSELEPTHTPTAVVTEFPELTEPARSTPIPSATGTPELPSTQSLHWERFDVNITVLENGDFKVEEIQEITFTSGTFSSGYRTIPMDRLENIKDVEVWEGDRRFEADDGGDYTYQTAVQDGQLRIKWRFPQTSDSRHTFVLRYTVEGGLRYYADGDQLYWKAVYADRDFPVYASMVTVKLPDNATAASVAAYDTEASTSGSGTSVVVFTAEERIQPGQEFEVRVQFPNGIVGTSKTPVHTPELRMAVAANYLGNQESGGVEIEIVRVMFGNKEYVEDQTGVDFETLSIAETDFEYVDTVAQFILRVTNKTDSIRSVHPQSGIVIVGDEQVELSAWIWTSIASLEVVGKEYQPGVSALGGFWFGVRRFAWDEVGNVTYIVDPPRDEESKIPGDGFRFEFDLSDKGYEPPPEELK